jgi:hypothetical protein
VTHESLVWSLIKCSICGRKTGRKDNANRHLQLVHYGDGEVIDLTGRRNRTLGLLRDGQRLLKTVELLVYEEYFRELARMKAREDYQTSGGKILNMEYDLFHALKSVKSAGYADHISASQLIENITGVSKLTENITGVDLFDESEGKKGIATAEQELKRPVSESEKRHQPVREPTLRELIGLD